MFIMSIQPRWSNLIINNQKTIELRKSFSKKVQKNDICFIYSSQSEKQLIGFFYIKAVEIIDVNNVNVDILNRSFVTHSEYDDYYKNNKKAVLIHLQTAQALKERIALSVLRQNINFQPPMSWRSVTQDETNYFLHLLH